ncbi:hypothetical protein LCGC14_1498380 [marine sediment metagenome]|uniref:Uncharacterized protein n=1 Tax=marine sediment metagenome TaxID=412755 RepID=A0A0F9LKH2_9ZZZZ
MVLTIKRKIKMGLVYRFWPTIKISQKTAPILGEIKDFTSVGHIVPQRTGYNYIVRGLDGIISFCNLIIPYAILKCDALITLLELAEFQRKHIRNIPYTYEEMVSMVDLRDKIFHYNQKTRTNLVQKYPREVILSETQFVDIRAWQLKRAEKGAIALEEAGKPYRFKKGVNHASK